MMVSPHDDPLASKTAIHAVRFGKIIKQIVERTHNHLQPSQIKALRMNGARSYQNSQSDK